MSAPVREPDDGPSKDGPLNYAPQKARNTERDQNSATAPREHGAAPQRPASDAAEPPWRRSRTRPAFAGDVEISELRSRLALAPDRLPEPPQPPTGPKYAFVGRLAGVAVVAAVGVVGYRWGSTPPASLPQLALPSGQSSQRGPASERSVSATYLDNQGLDSKALAGRPAAGGLSTGMAVDTARGVSSGATVGTQPSGFTSPAAAKAIIPQLNEQKSRDEPTSRAASPQLTVEAVQPVPADEPARLTISAAEAGANAAVVIGGLASGSALSSGTRAGPNTWRLTAEELGGAAITPPRGFVGAMDVTLELHLADNTVVDRKDLHLEWSGKSVPGPAVPGPAVLGPAKSQPRRLAADEIALMMKNGAEFMANGNVGAARMIFQPAAESGDPVAAFALAETYDPLVLRKLNVTGGIAADVSLAQSWYEKAKNLGSPVAPERLERLARLPE
jgi:TPR repeat protein